MKKVNDDADAYGNTYVHGGIEVEVKNTNEAIEAFRDAEKRKLSYQNTLKIDSSYSHFVFTIKLVQVFGYFKDENLPTRAFVLGLIFLIFPGSSNHLPKAKRKR